MILSHKYKFIFIRTQKTASSSVEISLSRYCGPDDVLTPMDPPDEEQRRKFNVYPQNFLVPLKLYRGKEFLRFLRGWRLKYWDHMSAKHIKRFIGEDIYNSYYKFCFERNPWEKTISYYFWENRKKKYNNFDDFIYNKQLCTDFHRYSINDKISVDFIGRYENLMEDLTSVCEKLNIPFDGWMPRSKGQYRKDRRPYTEFLSRHQREFIDQVFQREIEYFGYKYGE
jgi:hypothetical protein